MGKHAIWEIYHICSVINVLKFDKFLLITTDIHVREQQKKKKPIYCNKLSKIE